MEMQYFSSVKGRAFQRRGTSTYIGCKFVKDSGFVWDTEAVVAISDAEVRLHLKDYNNAVRRGSLKKCTAKDFDKHVDKQKAAAEKIAAEKIAAEKVAASQPTNEEG